MRRYNIKVGQHEYVIDVQEMAADRFRVWIGDRELEVHIAGDHDIAEASITPEMVPIRGDGEAVVRPVSIYGAAPASQWTTSSSAAAASVTPGVSAQAVTPPGAYDMVAPMPGTIIAVNIAPGDQVQAGQPLLVLEAMKMKNTLRSPQEGTIAEITVVAGQNVKAGSLLIRFAENPR